MELLGRFAMKYLLFFVWGEREEMLKYTLKQRYGARKFGKKCSSYTKRRSISVIMILPDCGAIYNPVNKMTVQDRCGQCNGLSPVLCFYYLLMIGNVRCNLAYH